LERNRLLRLFVSFTVVAVVAFAGVLLVARFDLRVIGYAMHTLRADDRSLALVRDAGFDWVIQVFSWLEIEPVPGEYFWEYPDSVIRACQYYNLNLAIRLDFPPEWASNSKGKEGVPVNLDAFAGFVHTVAQRYRGQVRGYIIWNEPNLGWGDRYIDPEAYVALLRVAYRAIKEADPAALVVTAGLAPTNEISDHALDDRIYLRKIYQAGAKEYFDVLGAHPHGFAYSPDDPYGAHEGLNFSRILDLRKIMVTYGDFSKPVWATELGWTVDPADPQQAWLRVTDEEQAAYLVGAFERAEGEWPWLSLICVWNLSAGLPPDDEMQGYSIVGKEYSPRPAYEALKALPKRGKWMALLWPAWLEFGKVESEYQILAPDVVVRLGDVDTFHPHWARIYGGKTPSPWWKGHFYIKGLPSDLWRLTMETMKVEERGNFVTINGYPLDPPTIPLRSKPNGVTEWVTVSFDVRPGILQEGLNTIEIKVSKRLPVYQGSYASRESIQFRNIRLMR